MRGVHTGEQVRAAEDALMGQLPGGALMARAAQGLAVECARLLGRVYGARVVLLVGAGNNGGDALYAGARLAERGARVTALLIDPPRAHAEGLLALDRAGGRCCPARPELVTRADLVIDGILGIGGVRGRAQVAGGGVLCPGAAVHGGAGMGRYRGLAPDEIRSRYPEVVIHPGTMPSQVRVQSYVLGPGLGTGDAARALVEDVLATDL